MRETITLAQPPCEERQRVAGKHLGRKKKERKEPLCGKKANVRKIGMMMQRKLNNCVFYLGAQAYSTLKQLTESGNQFSQNSHIQVLQTLNTKTAKYMSHAFVTL